MYGRGSLEHAKGEGLHQVKIHVLAIMIGVADRQVLPKGQDEITSANRQDYRAGDSEPGRRATDALDALIRTRALVLDCVAARRATMADARDSVSGALFEQYRSAGERYAAHATTLQVGRHALAHPDGVSIVAMLRTRELRNRSIHK